MGGDIERVVFVSIRAPHARGDESADRLNVEDMFQSAPLMRGATLDARARADRHVVSIRAPHARGDQSALSRNVSTFCFNPRPSCEGRRYYAAKGRPFWVFQSAPLMRGATRWVRRNRSRRWFQSAPLMRGATGNRQRVVHLPAVSIRAPHARGDAGRVDMGGQREVSIRAPHARGDEIVLAVLQEAHVSIRAPHARGDCVTMQAFPP